MTSATDNRMTELLPCRLCGSKAHMCEMESGYGTEYAICCNYKGCRLSEHPRFGHAYKTEAEAIAAWNTRAELGSEINGETSDGYHTFNELYHHRAVLFSVIVRDHRDIAWKARKHHDGTMYDGMFIVGIETPKGQATYHYDLDPYWEMFDCEEREYAPEWDGHTPDDAIARIAELGSEREKKLEELVKQLWYLVNHRSGYGYAAALESIEELGIEVDE